jgi:hypothetical protein
MIQQTINTCLVPPGRACADMVGHNGDISEDVNAASPSR